MVVAPDGRRLIGDIAHERSLKRSQCLAMSKLPGECLQNREIARTLKIENPTGLLRLIVLFEPEFSQGFEYLASAVANPVGLTHERYYEVSVRSLVQQHFGVTCGDDLAPAVASHVRQELVDLTLAKDLEMCVRLVQQQDGTRIRIHVREEEKSLLKTSSG